jgi:hypothetical protein
MGRYEVGAEGDGDDRHKNRQAEDRAAVLAERRPECGKRRGLGEHPGRLIAEGRGSSHVSGHGESSD